MNFTLVSKGFLSICLVVSTVTPCMAQGWSWFNRSNQNQQQAQSQYAQPSQAQYQNGQANNYTGYSYNYGTYPSQQQQTAPQYSSQRNSQQSQQAPAKAATRNRSSSSQSSADTSRWYTSWDVAWEKARSQGRPLVVIVVHHGCPVCDQLDATLSNPAAMATLDSAVKARLEFSDNPEFLNRTGVKLTPTFLVFSPTSNGEVYREVGALSLQRLQSLKPSIDSLVSEPAPARTTKSRKSAQVETAPALNDQASSLLSDNTTI